MSGIWHALFENKPSEVAINLRRSVFGNIRLSADACGVADDGAKILLIGIGG